MARKLARRCYHTLRNVDPEEVYAMPAWPPTPQPAKAARTARQKHQGLRGQLLRPSCALATALDSLITLTLSIRSEVL